MPYVYRDARKLEGEKKIGDFECVTLIRHFTRAPWTGAWRQGEPVVGNRPIQEGTAIANFVNGKWPGLDHGNHSAFYLGQLSNGIYIIMGKMQKRGKNEWTETYQLDAGCPEGVWFQCAYGESNSHTLAKKLDASVKSCMVKGKAGSKSGQNIFDISCS